MANIVLPTPDGRMKSALVASSQKRSVPSSFTRLRSIEGCASKSKSSPSLRG